jgi:hypothetical protein
VTSKDIRALNTSNSLLAMSDKDLKSAFERELFMTDEERKNGCECLEEDKGGFQQVVKVYLQGGREAYVTVQIWYCTVCGEKKSAS